MAEASQASTSDDINIKIKTMQPATYDVKIPVEAPVAELKKRLVDIANVPQERQRVIYKGRVLENDQLLSSHGVQDGHTLHLVERMPGPPQQAAGQQAAGQPADQPGQRHFPVATGSLELDTDENDVSALMANIFQQLGGQGQMPGLVPGDGGSDAGGDGQHGRAQEAQFIAQQLMDSLAQGGPPGERPPNMLASIQSYLNRTQELMQNPTVLLPSLPDPSAPEIELRAQRRLMEAVRGILTSSVQSELSSEQQAFLQDERSWEPPAQSAGSSSRQSTASRSASAQAAAPTDTSAAAPSASFSAQAPADATAHYSSLAAAVDAGAAASVTGAAAQQQPAEQQQLQQQRSHPQSASGTRRDAPSGDNARSADGRRHRRSRRPAISPVVTMALGSLLQSTLQGDAYRDPAGVLTNAAQLLLSSHSFEGGNRQQILDSLRAAGSHLYRLAPLLLELARAFSGAVAAMQGQAGPLALNASSYIRPDGSAPAIGHTPSGAHQQIIGSMSIPLFPGMPVGVMHMGPEGPVPNMTGPVTAPAANGPPGANPGATDGAGPGSGAAPPAGAGAGQGAGRGQGIGLNQAVSHLLQSAMVQAGGQAARPGPGIAMTETRQVIQVPGAPPISIRFGARPMPSQRSAEAQQAPADVPVTLQIGNSTPVSLEPLIQVVSSMLGSAIHSAIASATPATATPATANPATANPAAAPAAASAAPVAAPPGSQAQPPQPGSNTRSPAPASSSSGSPAPASLLAPPVVQQVSRALMHVISPLINAQAAPPSTSAVAAASAAATQVGRAAPLQSPLAPEGRPSQNPPAPGNSSSAAAETVSDAGAASSRPATAPRPLGMSEPLSEMIGGTLADATTPGTEQSATVDAQGIIGMLMGAGASAVSVSGPMAAPDQQPGGLSATTAAASDMPEAPTAASTPPESTGAGAPAAAGDQSSSKPAEASDAAARSGGQRPSQRAMGLGSALPPREKGSKKSHPRSSMPSTSPSSPDEAAGSRQAGGRPAPSVPQQDNVKRARHGDNTPDASPRPVAGTHVQPAAAARAGLDEEEEISRPTRGAVQAGSAGGLDAMLAQRFGGGGGTAGGSGAGGLNLNSLVQGSDGRSRQLSQGAAAGGQGASSLFGALAQSIGPMMQQLMVGDGRSNSAQGPTSTAPTQSSTADWESALSELDGEEQSEWERVIRADLQKQAELTPQRYKDHSTAYLAGRPPSTKNSLLPGDSSSKADQEDSD